VATGANVSLTKAADGPVFAARWPCPGDGCSASARLVDEWGNTVWSAELSPGATAPAPVAEVAPQAVTAPSAAPASTTAWYRRKGPWFAVAGAAFLAAAIGFTVRAVTDHTRLMSVDMNRASYTYASAMALQGAVNREQVFMWVGYGAVVAFGVAAALTW
jgi:hypothetical protein